MTASKALRNRIRGWLPKEPRFSTAQKSVDQKFSPIVRWTARAFVAGTAANAVLLVVGDLRGLMDGVGVYLWPIAVFVMTCVPIAAVSFLVKHKEKQQRRSQTWE
jgi:hypothetical protein